MNAMLAAVCPSTPPGPAAAKRAACGDGDDARAGGFADCMEQALDAAQPPEAQAASIDDTSANVAVAEHDAADAAPALPDATPPLPELAVLLPGWMAVPAPAAFACETPPAEDEPLGTALTALGASSAARAAASARAEGPTPATTAAALDAASGQAESTATFTAMPAPAPASADAAGGAAQPARTPPPDTAPATSALPAAPQPLLAAAPRAAEAAATTATLPAAIDSPAFAPALATQVRWWAQDGVQQAQLTLNPPEMGPVAVKIVVLDGREARIDFSTDMAATRSAIEAALPVLAAALDENGLKLSGGGVHDGSAQRQAAWQEASQQHQQQQRGVTYRTDRTRGDGTAAGAEALAAASASRTAPGRGLVDLVA